jgi:tRNA(Ile)-lysidine synthase
MCATASKPPGDDATALRARLRELIRAAAPPALCLGFSGGPDSTALLHALAQLPEARGRGLRAIHVDHGLHPDSAAWARHCADFCAALQLPSTSVRVEVDTRRGEGIEAAARHARRKAFAERLGENEWLLLAHHRDDQIETVLLKLLRGAGPEGLGGMRALRPFARSFLWRPLLGSPREDLREYVHEHGLQCIDDPANDATRFSRNVLRHDILPRIAAHWPHADAAILHSARLCREVAGHVEREAGIALASLRGHAGTLDVDGWLALPAALRVPALQQWLRERSLPVPGDAQGRELQQQASTAAADALPCIAWPGAEVRIWHGRLHAMPPLSPLPGRWQASWDGAPLALPGDCGTLVLETVEGSPGSAEQVRFQPPLSVRQRRGGERIKPVDDRHTRALRDLFQRARMPPWLRGRCPLIFAGDELIAVAGLWLNARGKAAFDAHGVRPAWLRPAWLNGS